ncbi:hypothetical protein LEN26_004392 [Aphanomyces euteiches]|nr:hypothetical protein AeMF1_007998 [Aphanomyces euteiches]KAH9148831.1 hypothetical protein LEN26_004392 [Aphanomyces euteiches]KAH9167970.1 hypothetical protein AeNC1_018017 [Aphanomyces euteiches]
MKATFLTTALLALSVYASNLTRGIDGRLRSEEQIQAIQDDASTNRQCQQTNGDYLSSLSPGTYATSKFHKCFHTSAQIFELVDTFVSQNPTLLTKFALSKTVNGQTIYGYKLSHGGAKSQSLYFQALQHAREWISGSSLVYSFASILDDIANGKATAADTFDLIFVPIVNIDGYDITWNSNRYQRKNANEVDLNRNWPSYYTNPNPPSPDADDYPGTSALSEPETKGIDTWLNAHSNEIAGWIDLHCTRQPIGNGDDAKFQKLGKNIQAQMGSSYTAETSATLYVAYGCFDDYHYRKFRKPVLTIEMAGTDFVTPASGIVSHGGEIYRAINQFAKEVVTFNGGSGPTPSTTKATPSPSSKPTPAPSTTSAPKTTKPTTPAPVSGCGTCTYCYYPDGDECLSDFTQSDCNYYSSSYGTIWCGN